MIVGLNGVVVKKEPTKLHIDVAGVVYEVHISLNSANLIEEKSSIYIQITQIIREDANLLFGFLQESEQRLFETLIKINGIGSKVAMAVCSTFTPESFADIISSKDVAMLKKVPGIGPKSANRVIVELEGFNIALDEKRDRSREDATLALETLGFKRDAINRALADESGDTATLVKIGLKKLSKV